MNLVRAFVFNFERLDILRDSIGHPSKNLLSFEFVQSFCFQLRASRYLTGLNRTFVQLRESILRDSSRFCLNLLRSSFLSLFCYLFSCLCLVAFLFVSLFRCRSCFLFLSDFVSKKKKNMFEFCIKLKKKLQKF